MRKDRIVGISFFFFLIFRCLHGRGRYRIELISWFSPANPHGLRHRSRALFAVACLLLFMRLKYHLHVSITLYTHTSINIYVEFLGRRPSLTTSVSVSFPHPPSCLFAHFLSPIFHICIPFPISLFLLYRSIDASSSATCAFVAQSADWESCLRLWRHRGLVFPHASGLQGFGGSVALAGGGKDKENVTLNSVVHLFAKVPVKLNFYRTCLRYMHAVDV